MKFLILLLLLTCAMSSLRASEPDIEESFPASHPTRAQVLTTLLTPLQQSLWQWERDGVFERRGDCLHWWHVGDDWQTWNSTCLRVEGQHHYLTFTGDGVREVLEFVARPGIHWSLDELLELDSTKLAHDLIRFSSTRTGMSFDYSPGHIHFRTTLLGNYEFFALTTPWGEGGLRQEVFGRCLTCSSHRYRAFLSSDGSLIYHASHLSGEISPRDWGSFMTDAYTYALEEMAKQLNYFVPYDG